MGRVISGVSVPLTLREVSAVALIFRARSDDFSESVF